ncbi:unnamed protein product, partial [Musa acuminata subsp. burmannicoides]
NGHHFPYPRYFAIPFSQEQCQEIPKSLSHPTVVEVASANPPSLPRSAPTRNSLPRARNALLPPLTHS